MNDLDPPSEGITRRLLLSAAALTGIEATLAASASAATIPAVPVQTLKNASAAFGDRALSDERLKIVGAALQQNLREFKIVHDFKVADWVEPAPIFTALRHDDLPKEAAEKTTALSSGLGEVA